MWKTRIKSRIRAAFSTSSLVGPRLLIVREDISSIRRGSARLLDVYNEITESESVEAEDPDNEETTQRRPALNTSTGLL